MTPQQLIETPDQYFHAIDGRHAVFLPMDRVAYRRSIFLDARIQPADPQGTRISLDQLLPIATARVPQRTGWIFHVAQCGSTLLARGLDREDANLVLREPIPLRQLGVAGSAKSQDAHQQHLLHMALAMAGRRYQDDMPTIVKATVPVNFILPRIAAFDPQAPAIFLYFPLDAYLLAILRGPRHRQWVTRLTGELAAALEDEAPDLPRLSEAERAAALWLAQLRRFGDAMALMRNSFSLDAETLFSQPRAVIAAAAALFGAPMADDPLDRIIASDLFSTYSKNPAIAFDNQARIRRQQENAATLAPELATARRWVESRLSAASLPACLDRPLVGVSPLLL